MHTFFGVAIFSFPRAAWEWPVQDARRSHPLGVQDMSWTPRAAWERADATPLLTKEGLGVVVRKVNA